MRMGTMVIAIAGIHTIFGFIAFSDIWMQIINEGLFNSIGEDYAKGAVIWFFLFGPLLFSYGYLIRHTEISQGKCPDHVLWHMLALFFLGAFFMPESGFWLLLIPFGTGLWQRKKFRQA